MNAPSRTESKALLRMDSVSVRRGDTLAVERVDLAVEEGTFFVLVGPSGCGKTSLLRAIAGFEQPIEGTIRLGPDRISGPDEWWAPERRQVGMVFQDGALFPHLTVRSNVLYGVETRPDGAARAARVLELVRMADCANRYPDELSGGERQRVALARALAPSPRLLLLDEPFASLDAGLRRSVRDEVRAIIDQTGITAILVTHDQEEALSLADRLAVMKSGRILQEGRPEEVYVSPNSVEVGLFLGGGQILPCQISAGSAHCVLGETPTEIGASEGWMLVRPEQIGLVEHGRGETDGIVRQRHFFGHGLVLIVELSTGEVIEVRAVPGCDTEVGQRIGLKLLPDSIPVFRLAPDEALGSPAPSSAPRLP